MLMTSSLLLRMKIFALAPAERVILTSELRLLQNTDKLEELRSQAAQEKVVSKWRMRVDERRSEPDKPLTKDRSDQPPKLVRVQKTEGSNSSESVAKKWLSKSKAGRAAHTAPRRQLPATTGSKWAAAKSKTLAVNRLNNLAKHAGPLPQNNSGDATTGTRVNALKSSSAQSILANKPSSLQSSFANKPSSLQSSFANKPSSLQSSFANKPSSLQSSFANKPSSLQSSFANKPVHPSSASAAPKSAPNARANWRTAAVKSKTVGNLTKSVGSSTVGSKKPYVPYKSPAKSGMGMKPGLAAKRGPQKLGGAKMGGKFF